MKRVEFYKVTAGGNDFVVIDCREKSLPRGFFTTIPFICTRRFSLGADGLILIERSLRADLKVRFFNPDGNEINLCGNGLRCSARLAYEERMVDSPKMMIETAVGVIKAGVSAEMVRVEVSPPKPPSLFLAIDVAGERVEGHHIDVGVPYFVVPVLDLDQAPVLELGRKIRYHEKFAPEGTNVDFVLLEDEHRLRLKIYERGVEDETLSSGTGSLAAALVFAALGKVSSPVSCVPPSGIVNIVDFSYDNGVFKSIFLEGEARLIARGKLLPDAFLG
jgi:diaminopimelate epimerase